MQINKTNKKRRKKNSFFTLRRIGVGLLLTTTAVVLFLKIATWLNAQEMFLVKDVEVEGNEFLQDEEILQLVEIDSSKHLFAFDLRNIEEQVSQHQLIEKTTIARALPSTLVIRVQEKEPLAILYDGKLYPIDKEGTSLEAFQSEIIMDFPVITKRPEEAAAFRQILSFLQEIKENRFSLYSQISEVSFSSSKGIYFYLSKAAIPVIVGHGDFRKRSDKFLRILKTLKNEQFASIKYFDLRFKDQVVMKTS